MQMAPTTKSGQRAGGPEKEIVPLSPTFPTLIVDLPFILTK